MNEVELTQVLEATVSSDKAALQAAQKYLEDAASTNLELLLGALSNRLADSNEGQLVRTAAAIQLKNYLSSKDDTVKAQYHQRWLAFDINRKLAIKQNIVRTLGTEAGHPSNAAQCVAAIAQIELPLNQWPDLIQLLVQNCATQGVNPPVKEASIEALGYIVEDIDPSILVVQSNMILTAIINAMRKEEPNERVRVAGGKALFNSLDFCRDQFDRTDERNYIMQVICEATQTHNTKLKIAALQCLSKCMSLYYKYMENYMSQALFALTLESLESKDDEVALQGIEFWSTTCDEETDLAIEAQEAAELGEPPDVVSKHYMLGALQYLMPPLLKRLTIQEEFDDDDDWNPNKAAGVCLMLIAQCCTDHIVPHVIGFQEHISHSNWRFREAAVMSFGCIVDGPDPKILNQHAWNLIPHLINMLKTDASLAVRDTCAWTLGRISERLPQTILQHPSCMELVEALLMSLETDPRVATNACWAFSSLAESAYEAAENVAADNEEEPATYILSGCYEQIITRLLATTDRADASQNNLRSAAYEAIMELLKSSPRDCYHIVQRTTETIIQRLQQLLFHKQTTAGEKQTNYNDLQSLLCATLQCVIRKMQPADAVQISDTVMGAFLMMMSSNSRSSEVQEDALMAIGTLVEVTGKHFAKHMENFWPYLLASLQNHAEYSVCGAAVGLVGDMCRTFGPDMVNFSDRVMELLVAALSNANLHQSIKPSILSTFGDVALAVGPHFANYLSIVIHILQQASEATVDKDDYEMWDYFNELREGILEAYCGIVQGLKGEETTPNQLEALRPYLEVMIALVISVSDDKEKSDTLTANACGLLGDLIVAYGGSIKALLQFESIPNLLTQGRRSRVSKTKSVAQWASREMRKINAL